MRSKIIGCRFAAMVAAVTLFASSARPQVCPASPPRVANEIRYAGILSGCGTGRAAACWNGETITLTAAPWPGYQFQSCDSFKWRPYSATRTSGDPDWISTGSSPTFSFSVPLSYTSYTDLRYQVIIRNSLGEDGAQYSTHVPMTTPPCPPSVLPSAVTLNYRGAKSGCTPNSAACVTNEALSFNAELTGYGTPTPNCDTLTWSFEWLGSQILPVDAKPTVTSAAYAGEYWVIVRFRDQHGLESTSLDRRAASDALIATARVRVVPADLSTPRRRSARH